MLNRPTQSDRIGSLETPLGEDILVLYRMQGQEGLSELFEWRVEALTTDEEIDEFAVVGHECSVIARVYGGENRIYHGICTDVQWLGVKWEHQHYELILRPWLWFLSVQSDSRIFKDRTVDEIINEVFDFSGFANFRFEILGEPPVIPYCVQYQESNLAFISRLMERHGRIYFFEHQEDRHTLVITDTPMSHRHFPGYETVPYFPTGHDNRERDHFSGLTRKRRIRSDRVDVNDYNYERASANLFDAASNVEQHGHHSNSLYSYLTGFQQRSDAHALAQTMLQAHKAKSQRFMASGTAMGICSGYRLTVENSPLPEQELLCVRARHELISDEYRSDDETPASQPYTGSFEFMPWEVPFRAPQTTPWPKIGGHQTATVVGEEGEEIDVDDQGRILVHFHWERAGECSCRVRVAQALAGSGFGAVQIPRIGHEVVVSFIDGDPDRPLVVGSVYNSDNPVPLDFPAAKTQMGFKSNSSKGGGGFNELILDDNKGSEGIRLHAQKDMTSVIENDQTAHIKNDKTTEVNNDMSTKVNNNQAWEIQNNRDTTITAGDDTTSIDGGNRSTTISSGNDVLSLLAGNLLQTLNSGSIVNNVGVGGILNNIGVGPHATNIAAGMHTTNVAAGFIQSYASGPISMKSGEAITLTVGASSITILDGEIEIKSPTIKLTADAQIVMISKGEASLVGAGEVAVKGAIVNINC